MRETKRIVFWQTVPSPHQSAFISALSGRAAGVEVLCVFERALDRARLDMGWKQPDFGGATVVVGPSREHLDELLEQITPDSVSIVSGIANRHWSRAVLRKLIDRAARVGLLSEGRDYRGPIGALRVLHGQFVERRFRRWVDFVLTMGKLGITWYRLCGYSEARIFSFPYVVETVEYEERAESGASEAFQIIVVAQLIRRKNIDMLIDVLARLRNERWVCSIVGDGPEGSRLRAMAARYGLGEQILFKGTLPNAAVRAEFTAADLLVLPSVWDGWGAVVNEALMQGTTALVSDYCGAAELIEPGFNGELFVNRSATSLEGALRKCLEKGKVGSDERLRLKDWSKSIQGEAVADYLSEILAHVYESSPAQRPQAPWSEQKSSAARRRDIGL